MTSYFPPVNAARSSNGTPTMPVPASSPLSPPPSNVQRSTALTNRLTSVLSASYADSDIRDALETLSLRGIHNTAETRRQLRLDVQQEVIDCNAEIVRDFGKVAEQLKRIGTVIKTLNQTCNEMRRHITLAKQDTTPVLEEAAVLMTQKEESETKQKLLDAFTKHFIVLDDDFSVLTSSETPVDDHFFDVLARVKQVHHDCEVLLGGENQRLGLEVMEQSSRNLNLAYQKLYKWIQKEFKSLNLEDPQISSSIRRALRVLAERPSLFHSCLDFFAEARDYALSDAFHYALTDAVSGAGADRTVKPIEFSAHDPLRYVGDMLAWVHSAAVSEREALEALFIAEGEEIAKGMKAGLSSEPWSRINEESEDDAVFDGHKALSELVNRNLTGVSRSLRQRVELVIQGHDDPATCYKVVNLLTFYRETFSRLLGAQSQLVDLTESLKKYTFNHFEVLMGEEVKALSAEHAALVPPEDLSAPQFLLDALEVLISLMKAFDASFGASSHAEDGTQPENDFTPALHAALDPFVDLAKSSAQELRDPASRTIFETNVLLTVRSTITPFSFAAATHLQPLSTAISTLRMDLLAIQHRYLLDMSGLQELLTALAPFAAETSDKQQQQQQGEEEEPPNKKNLVEIASLPAFQPENLVLRSQQLDDFLPSALMDATDHLKRVQSAAFVKSVTEEAVEAFCRDFEFVEGMIIGADEASSALKQQPEGEETEEDQDWSLRALFPRTTGEIRVLLS